MCITYTVQLVACCQCLRDQLQAHSHSVEVCCLARYCVCEKKYGISKLILVSDIAVVFLFMVVYLVIL